MGADCGETIATTREVTDSLQLARRMHPGQKNSLDALCKRYAIDNSQRTLHGALLDAEILADVYLAMTGGQTALNLQFGAVSGSSDVGDERREGAQTANLELVRLKVDAVDEEAHRRWMDLLGDKSLFS